MTAIVLLLPEAREDFRALDGQAQRIVAAGLKKLRTDPQLRGQPLGSKANAQSNLTGLRKLVVGNRTYRIVYEIQPDGTVVVVWVIAGRADSEAYRLANARLMAYDVDARRKAILAQMLEVAYRGG